MRKSCGCLLVVDAKLTVAIIYPKTVGERLRIGCLFRRRQPQTQWGAPVYIPQQAKGCQPGKRVSKCTGQHPLAKPLCKTPVVLMSIERRRIMLDFLFLLMFFFGGWAIGDQLANRRWKAKVGTPSASHNTGSDEIAFLKSLHKCEDACVLCRIDIKHRIAQLRASA